MWSQGCDLEQGPELPNDRRSRKNSIPVHISPITWLKSIEKVEAVYFSETSVTATKVAIKLKSRICVVVCIYFAHTVFVVRQISSTA